jgi:8-oxo-dGTP pyrophosphatase MutT (NUDIX family)
MSSDAFAHILLMAVGGISAPVPSSSRPVASSSILATNVACVILTPCSKIMFVRGKRSGKLMVPGGRREHKETNWKATRREFKEEAGMEFPAEHEVDFSTSFLRTHRNGDTTKIYVGRSSKTISWFRFNRDGVLQDRPETDAIEWLTYDEAIRSSRVEEYVKNSLREARDLRLI